MSRRTPSTPPVLSGMTSIRLLGRGGFADVFLYEQALPRGEVAVKVLLPGLADGRVREMFLSEANHMSQLKAHPAVVPVYAASIAPDGRPYLVMEHCPSSFGQRYKHEQIPVPEVISVGIKIGSALESAHRLGILHRDVKPSNILLTQYGHPVLADFGIASTLAEAHSGDAAGMSIPWSAPEILRAESTGTVRSEVWSLAATLYTLLAGRTPFEVIGKANSRDELQARIVGRDRLSATGRYDVPPELEALLGQAMTKNAEARPDSILAFVRQLQLVESGMGLPQTPADIAEYRAPVVSSGAEAALPVAVTVRKPGEGRRRHEGRVALAAAESARASQTITREGAVAKKRSGGAFWIVAGIIGGLAVAGGAVVGVMALVSGLGAP